MAEFSLESDHPARPIVWGYTHNNGDRINVSPLYPSTNFICWVTNNTATEIDRQTDLSKNALVTLLTSKIGESPTFVTSHTGANPLD